MEKKCKNCKNDVVKRGFRYTNLGKKQLFLCKSCNRKQTLGWTKMRYKKEIVMHAVAMYEKGYSLSRIKSALREDGTEVSRWSILKWVRKFG